MSCVKELKVNSYLTRSKWQPYNESIWQKSAFEASALI